MISVIKDCKKLVRNTNNFVRVDTKFFSNNYYDTEIFSVNFGGNEVFSLQVESDSVGTDYKLSYDNDYYMPKGWYQTVKMKNLRRLLKRKAEKQKKMVARNLVPYVGR